MRVFDTPLQTLNSSRDMQKNSNESQRLREPGEVDHLHDHRAGVLDVADGSVRTSAPMTSSMTFGVYDPRFLRGLQLKKSDFLLLKSIEL